MTKQKQYGIIYRLTPIEGCITSCFLAVLKKIKIIFEKPIDKAKGMWYNNKVARKRGLGATESGGRKMILEN